MHQALAFAMCLVRIDMMNSHGRDIVVLFHGLRYWEPTGMPMKDFFDCTTSPSTILAFDYVTVQAGLRQKKVEWRGFGVMVVVYAEVVWVGEKRMRREAREQRKSANDPCSNFTLRLRTIPITSSRIIPRLWGKAILPFQTQEV